MAVLSATPFPTNAAPHHNWVDRLHGDPFIKCLHPDIIAFYVVLSENTRLSELCTCMFAEAKQSTKLTFLSVGATTDAVSSLMLLLSRTMQKTPRWDQDNVATSLVGVPFSEMLRDLAPTPSGLQFFRDKEVNRCIKRIINSWGQFLETRASTQCLNSKNGWCSPAALNIMATAANRATGHARRFTEIFECPDETDMNYLGFQSWDAFFTRHFKAGVRPIPTYEDLAHRDGGAVLNPCEAHMLRVERNCSAREQFWVKGQPYSIMDMLDNDPLAERFVNGTVYQGHLSALSYHRWHSPVTGTVEEVHHVEGTYYSSASVDDAPPLMASQAYLSAVATRVLIFIRAKDPRVGLLCFIAVGMVEVSSCAVAVNKGDLINAGDEIGSFHFGGSSFCLVFEGGVDVQFEKTLGNDGVNWPVRSILACCSKKTE